MKKFISVLLAAAACVMLFAGCGETKEEGTLQVAVVQQLDHSSLQEIRVAVEARLSEIAKEKNLTIRYEEFNGQNDPTILGQIGSQIAGGSFDAVIPIGTLAAQCMVTATDGMEIPINYAAISDPAAAGLTGIPNVTGTSDALDTGLILDMMQSADSGIKTVGLLYSNSEPNSETPIAQAKELLDARGIAYVEKTGNTADEILTAASALVGRVDAVFTPTDNAVMNVAPAVSEVFNKNGIAYYTGADSFVSAGAFATCGVNYTELGYKTADMAVDFMVNGSCPEFQKMDGGIIAYNSDTAAALGLDVSVFASMASEVKDVK